MTTIKTTRFRLPDPPERAPDEMTSTKHLTMTGSAHYLSIVSTIPTTHW